jgi:hypothetical protein
MKMLRCRPIVAALAIPVIAVVALLALGGPARAARPRGERGRVALTQAQEQAGLARCAQSLQPNGREADFVGQMRSLKAGDHMAMRFTVLQRPTGAPAFTELAVLPWRVQPFHAPVWRWIEKVRDLPAAAQYRARVSYLWRNRHGAAIAHAQRTTPICGEADLRPNLHYSGLRAVALSQPGLARYTVSVRNTGRSPAPAFDTTLVVNGEQLAPVSAPGLAPTQAEGVVFKQAPRCLPGSELDVAIDPSHLIDESNETDNTATVPCPLP